jgi:hypothetical protein
MLLGISDGSDPLGNWPYPTVQPNGFGFGVNVITSWMRCCGSSVGDMGILGLVVMLSLPYPSVPHSA